MTKFPHPYHRPLNGEIEDTQVGFLAKSPQQRDCAPSRTGILAQVLVTLLVLSLDHKAMVFPTIARFNK
jgi:hypothetical protein